MVYTYSVKDIEALLERAVYCNQVIGARRAIGVILRSLTDLETT
jgi:hypothetical protein